MASPCKADPKSVTLGKDGLTVDFVLEEAPCDPRHGKSGLTEALQTFWVIMLFLTSIWLVRWNNHCAAEPGNAEVGDPGGEGECTKMCYREGRGDEPATRHSLLNGGQGSDRMGLVGYDDRFSVLEQGAGDHGLVADQGV